MQLILMMATGSANRLALIYVAIPPSHPVRRINISPSLAKEPVRQPRSSSQQGEAEDVLIHWDIITEIGVARARVS